LSICYDLNFPEVFRTLALKGARIILISSAWPAMAGDVWDALLPARAIENEVCVIASDQTGGEYLGHSKIVDWTGRVLAGMDREEGLATAVIDLEKQEKWRRIVTYFSDRRPDLYSLKETDGSPESR
jgi:predicted amidohydrolase